MLTKPEVACAIFDGISSVREDEELQDFIVEVEGKEFKCHRLILSACSGFFRGLFRSGMSESQKLRTKLDYVTAETFSVILDTLYTGSANVTRDNMLSVCEAADKFQFTVVFEHCVDFITSNICDDNVLSVLGLASQLNQKNVTEACEAFLRDTISLDNWENIYSASRTSGSDLLASYLRDFIKKNYENVIKSKTFLCLPEDELIEIIKSQDLVVSCEDVVVESIFNWVNNGSPTGSETKAGDMKNNITSKMAVKNIRRKKTKRGKTMKFIKDGFSAGTVIKIEKLEYDRKSCLERLLRNTRLCLVTSTALEKLMRDPLVRNDDAVFEMFMDANLYNSKIYQHGQCLQAAVHRRCSDLENVGVMSNESGTFYALTYNSSFQWIELPKCPFLLNCTGVKVFSYERDVFAIGDLPEYSSLCVFVQNNWREVCQIPGNGWLGVAIEECIFLMNSSNQQMKRFNSKYGNDLLEDISGIPTTDKIEHICSLDSYILAFCSNLVNDVVLTAIHCFDIRSKTWSTLESLEGSAEKLVSFRKEKQLYLLQTNGKLWGVNCVQNDVHINFMEAIWQVNNDMYGVIYFNECLFFNLGEEYAKEKHFSASSTLFPKNQLFISPGVWSSIVPAVIKSVSH